MLTTSTTRIGCVLSSKLSQKKVQLKKWVLSSSCCRELPEGCQANYLFERIANLMKGQAKFAAEFSTNLVNLLQFEFMNFGNDDLESKCAVSLFCL